MTDSAWREAEDALPDGWPLTVTRDIDGTYVASAGHAWPTSLSRTSHACASPDDALTALADLLRKHAEFVR